MAYDALLKSKILDPLNMQHTFITPDASQEKHFLHGHNAKGNLVDHRDYNALNPAMGIRSNVPDLLTFFRSQFDLEKQF